MIENTNKDKEFELACCYCGAQTELRQIAHRDNYDHVIGYVFVCPDCQLIISGKYKVVIMEAL